MKSLKGHLVSAMVVFMGLSLFAAGPASAKWWNLFKGKEKKPYKIGAIFDISGKASALGIPEKQTVEMVVEELNKAGGINGRPVELVFYDTAMDVQKTINSVNKLMKKDKVLAIIGPSTSGVSMAIMETIQNNEIPNVSCAARIDIIEPPQKWVFKTPQTDKQAVGKILDYMQKKGIKKVALMIVEGGFGSGGLIQLEAMAPTYGIEIVANEKFSEDDTNVNTQLTKIRGTEAEALVVWCTDKGSAKVAVNMKQLGMEMPIYMSHGIATMKFIEQAREAAEGVIFPAGRLVVLDSLPESDPQKEVLTKYAADFKAKYNATPDTFGGHAWDAIMVVIKAIEKAGDDIPRLRDEIENTKNFVGIGGVFNFSKEDHNGLGPESLVMVKIVNGQWTYLE
ncbi:MAG: ABC transporter substrate-binding protein [bacterium]